MLFVVYPPIASHLHFSCVCMQIYVALKILIASV